MTTECRVSKSRNELNSLNGVTNDGVAAVSSDGAKNSYFESDEARPENVLNANATLHMTVKKDGKNYY